MTHIIVMGTDIVDRLLVQLGLSDILFHENARQSDKLSNKQKKYFYQISLTKYNSLSQLIRSITTFTINYECFY